MRLKKEKTRRKGRQMIKTEQLRINGKAFMRTYSDQGMMIEREGLVYSEAVDPAELGRAYNETDTPVPKEDDGADL